MINSPTQTVLIVRVCVHMCVHMDVHVCVHVFVHICLKERCRVVPHVGFGSQQPTSANFFMIMSRTAGVFA